MVNQPIAASFQKHFTYLVVGLAFSTLSAAGQIPARLDPNGEKSARPVVVSIPDRKLALLEGERVVKTYNVAIGAPLSASPNGEFQIAQRLENSTYYRPDVVIGPGQDNPLGTPWMSVGVKGFGMHGTNRPDSIGKNASHRRMRLRNRDMEDLFARVQVGDRVSLIAERTVEVARLFGESPADGKAAETIVAKNEASATAIEEERGER
jgi:hypothetical protein